MRLKNSFIQIQRPMLAAVMQQSISVLMLSTPELLTAIDRELQSNPLLEIEHKNDSQLDSQLNNITKSLNYASDAPMHFESNISEDYDEAFPIPQIQSFEDYLIRQLHLEISCPTKIKIGELIIGNLNEDGYLTVDINHIAHQAGVDDTTDVEKVLKMIQLFDPIGIGARNLEECLTVQLNHINSALSPIAIKIANEHLNDLYHKRFDVIAHKTRISIQLIKDAAQLIGTLEPKPARNKQNTEQTFYIQPDIYVYKISEESFKIELNKKEIPLIKINPFYQKLLSDKKITDEERKFVQDKLTNAINFIKSIQQRGETVTLITQYILDHQTEFFKGNTSCLAPMSLKDIAVEIGRNESTISRAIQNKYIDTPQGVFPLKFFFSQAVNVSNCTVSSYNIKEEIKQIVAAEDKSSPLSDLAIKKYFHEKGIDLARRTISKYRVELRISSSHLRKV